MSKQPKTSKPSTSSNPNVTENTMTTTTNHTPTIDNPISPDLVTTKPALTPADVVFVQPPPPGVNIPPNPPGFQPPKGGFARGTRPKKSELMAMPDALTEMKSFNDWLGTLGKNMPPLDQTVQTFDAACAWSILRVATKAWDKYSSAEEGMAWVQVRALMDVIKPAFELAAKLDPSLPGKYPKLATLLGAKKLIAAKSVTARTANKQAKAAGQPEYHGEVGKKRQRQAEKAAAAAQGHTAPAPSPAVTPTSGTTHS